jgi:hypothetical protein
MRQLDLVWQARVYVNQARRTISAAQKTRLLAMAQRLLAINAKDVDGLTLVNTLVLPQDRQRASEGGTFAYPVRKTDRYQWPSRLSSVRLGTSTFTCLPPRDP